jgi:hypothetical protein
MNRALVWTWFALTGVSVLLAVFAAISANKMEFAKQVLLGAFSFAVANEMRKHSLE